MIFSDSEIQGVSGIRDLVVLHSILTLCNLTHFKSLPHGLKKYAVQIRPSIG